MDNKKKKELYYLKPFLKLYGISPTKINLNIESPDFIINYSGKKIGIEVTEYHSLQEVSGHSRREVESNWEKIQKKIYEIVKLDNGLMGTHVLIFLRKIILPSQGEIPSFINELISCTKIFIVEDKKSSLVPETYKILNKYIDRIDISKINDTSFLKWECNINTGSIGLKEKELLNVITPKISKEKIYCLKNLDELWLLVAFGWRISQSVPPRLKYNLEGFNTLNLVLSKSSYTHIFLYLHWYDVIYRWPNWKKFGKGKFFDLVG